MIEFPTNTKAGSFIVFNSFFSDEAIFGPNVNNYFPVENA